MYFDAPISLHVRHFKSLQGCAFATPSLRWLYVRICEIEFEPQIDSRLTALQVGPFLALKEGAETTGNVSGYALFQCFRLRCAPTINLAFVRTAENLLRWKRLARASFTSGYPTQLPTIAYSVFT